MNDSFNEYIENKKKEFLSTIREMADEDLVPQLDDLIKVLPDTKIPGAANKALNILGYESLNRSADEIIASSKYKNHIIIEQCRKPRLFFERDTYNVYDTAGKPIYFVSGKFWLGNHRLLVFKDGEQIGEIHKRLFTFPDILDGEHQLRICSIKPNDNKPYIMQTSIYSKQRRYTIQKRGLKLEYLPKERAYKILYQKNAIAQIYIPYTEDARNNRKLVIGYQNTDREPELIMQAIALHIMLRNDF